MDLVLIDKNNYKEAIKIQNSIFPKENGALNILASLDRNLFIKSTKLNYADDHVKYYLAKEGNRYVGITGIYYYDFDLDSAWLGWFGILQEYRDNGLGKELLNRTIDLAISNNFKYMRLYTDYIDNSNAIKLYIKEGFIGEKYTAEKLLYDCRIYSKSLTDEEVPLWNNRHLNLSNQSKLDQMDAESIKNIIKLYDKLIK